LLFSEILGPHAEPLRETDPHERRRSLLVLPFKLGFLFGSPLSARLLLVHQSSFARQASPPASRS
jgi:hypothetical protein